MIFSEIVFSEQLIHLGLLLVAILQPVFFLMLVIGFILTSAHFLTMLGTRWGDRRANSKALFFSIGIHGLLACGLIALIPEYQQTIVATTLENSDQQIQVEMIVDQTDLQAVRSESGNTPIWDQIQPSEIPDWQRFQAPPVDLDNLDRALDRPEEDLEFDPKLASDQQPLPSESNPAPEQEIQAEEDRLEEAAIEMTPQMLAIESQDDENSFAGVESRVQSPSNSLSNDSEESLSRPTPGSVSRIDPEFSKDRQDSSLAGITSPQARLMRSPDTDQTLSATGPIPALADPEIVGQASPSQPERSTISMASSPSISRSRPRRDFLTDEPDVIKDYRPTVTPTRPDQFSPDARVSESGQNRFQPIPGERPQMVLPDENLIARVEQRNIPSAYVLRGSEQLRENAVLKYGGSEASENAVDLSLKWLASVQNRDGSWDASRYGSGQVGIDDEGIDRQYAGKTADTGVTALAVLAFLGKLNTVDEGKYSEQVNRALRWLISKQRPRKWSNGDQTSGYLGGDATTFAGMYCHGMATFALAEAYALSKDQARAEFLRDPLEDAIQFILKTQIDDGGWRYIKGQPDGDMSMFGWQLMAIKSAEAGGITIPFEARRRMEKFLRDRQIGRYGGLAGYRAGDPPSPPMTAEALFCRQILQLDNDRSATEEATRYLLNNRPSRSTINLYYWYYGTLAMYQNGGREWDQWNAAVRDLLISEQRTVGPQAGSWDPRGEWGRYGGRIYSTAIATLSLEVYYRYLRDE